MSNIIQAPEPGQRQAKFCGDVVVFDLHMTSAATPGQAWLRTNLGRDSLRRREIMREARRQRRRQASDWRDIPMRAVAAGHWRLTLPLLEPGHFQAKAFFMPAHAATPVWPPGSNTIINVHPAPMSNAVLIYNAFVRQFGRRIHPDAIVARAEQSRLAQAGYTIIPPSGTFRDLIRELDFIIGRLGSRVLLLLPIHPTPTVFARMGVYGSPYAALDFFDVDPALAEFDQRRTPLEQFQELVDAVHARHARIWLDIAVNHTGWASKIHAEHPEWLARDHDDYIISPGAWGTVWEDLTELDHRHRALWDYLAEVFLFWCRRGVDGFRCDAAYMVPPAVWEYMLARVRQEFPETFFLLEGLGGPLETTAALMDTANLNGAYSELFQNYDRASIESYLPAAIQLAKTDGVMVHFAETHDNPRLALKSAAYAKMRTALSALCSINGAFAFANGVEWLATEKIDVHGRASLNWGADDNQVDWVRRLQTLLRDHPAFTHDAHLSLVHQNAGNAIALLRQSADQKHALLILVNLDDNHPQNLSWQQSRFNLADNQAIDLLSGRLISTSDTGALSRLELAPAEVLCLTLDPADLERARALEEQPCATPERVTHQRHRAKALEIICAFRGYGDVADVDVDQAARDLARDPAEYCQKLAPDNVASVTRWTPPRDCHRVVMVPTGHSLLVKQPHPFRLRLLHNNRVWRQEDAIPLLNNNGFFVLLPPNTAKHIREIQIQAEIFAANNMQRVSGTLLLLPPGEQTLVANCLGRDACHSRRVFLATNGRGGMTRAPLDWGKLYSRYDALLAANLHPRHPVDRWVMFTRCRAWLEHHGYSRELNADSFISFTQAGTTGIWRFRAAFGDVGQIEVSLQVAMPEALNAVQLTFTRVPAAKIKNAIPDHLPVTLILRPDLEDRNFHEDTLAYTGPEQSWSAAVKALSNGFNFLPHPERPLQMRISSGTYHAAPEWQYMVFHPVEAERGLREHTDLFSPGYFRAALVADQPTLLSAGTPTTSPSATNQPARAAAASAEAPATSMPLSQTLARAMRQFIVRRDNLQTVIAGYPWFLDWGRDTLICARGMIAAGMLKEVRDILLQFASFEQDGTLPNMISGADASNRDTSDAPLWFIIACADWRRAAGDDALLTARAGKRSVRAVITSIIENYSHGTPNGVRMDADSALIYSPSHFTWMDTNFPAATPRAGYPVEIQALWWAALSDMAAATHSTEWRNRARQAQDSFVRLFWDQKRGFLSDCRHAAPGTPAEIATPDDALRPNQLLAITLGLLENPMMRAGVLEHCAELLTPGAIRSLADRPVSYPLPVQRDGHGLNDPHNPYWPRYEGDEDTRRKPAYHNGTAWTWMFPSFSEAWFQHYGAAGLPAARSWLHGGIKRLINAGCIGQLPEIVDGGAPHNLRGCDAQAWGVTEAFRVMQILEPNPS